MMENPLTVLIRYLFRRFVSPYQRAEHDAYLYARLDTEYLDRLDTEHVEIVIEAGDYKDAPVSDGTVTVSGPGWEYTVPTRMAHCDPLVLHQPGDCVFCDRYADLQQIRLDHNVKFTGADRRDPAHQYLMPCPAEVVRGDLCQEWPGNTPKRVGDRSYLG